MMGQAFKPTLTDAGRALLNQVSAGGTITVTRAQLGSGRLPEDAPIEPLTALLDPKVAAQVKGSEAPKEEEAIISIQYENSGLADGFDIYELGIFARSTESAEVLYFYMTFGDAPDPVTPASTGKVLRSYDIPIRVDSRLEVSVEIDASALATTNDIQKILDGTTPPAVAWNGPLPAAAQMLDSVLVIDTTMAPLGSSYEVSITTPAVFVAGTPIKVNGATLQGIFMQNGEPLDDDAWAAGVPACISIRGDKAYYKAGGSGGASIYQSNTAPTNPKTLFWLNTATGVLMYRLTPGSAWIGSKGVFS